MELENKCAHHAFKEQAQTNPSSIAVENGNVSITYGDLNKRANQLAGVLISNGLQTGDFVD